MSDREILSASALNPTTAKSSLASPAPPRRVRRPGARSSTTCASSSRRRASAARRSTTCCCSARPGSARRRSRTIIAHEMGVPLHVDRRARCSSAPAISPASSPPRAGEVLFIDEIHRLSPMVEEILYPAMEDFQLDLVIGQGPAAQTRQDRRCRASRWSAPPRAPACSPRRCARASASSTGSTSTAADDLDADRARARRACSASPIDDDGARGDRRRAAAARRASPTACCAACATSRRSSGDGRDRRATVGAARARRCSRSTSYGFDEIDRKSCSRSSSSTTAARSASRRSPRRSARTAARSRTSTSPS